MHKSAAGLKASRQECRRIRVKPPRRSATNPGFFALTPAIRPRRESNRLYRANLAKGQTGLSIAFDLPTQTGYDSDHPLARGEVGKVGVAISHIGDMRALFEDIPVASMNTSMTINATALLADGALYRGRRRAGRAARAACKARRRTTSSRNIFRAAPTSSRPSPSLRLTKDLILFCARETPKWNPMNVCSYHLQEAGATPAQELSLRARDRDRGARPGARESGEVDAERFRRRGRPDLVLRQRRHALRHRTRQDARLRRTVGRDRARPLSASTDPAKRRFRYGVQVNSLGLTEQQPENNAYRILIEMLSVVLSKNGARPRGAIAGLERGARPAAPVRPAMVAAPAADHGLRDRPARIRRSLRRQPRDRRARSRN